MSSKQILVSFAIAAAAVTVIVAFGFGKRAYAQPAAPRFAISSTISMGTVSTAWIVDPTTRRVIFCRQSSPTGTSEQVLDFSCNAKPLS